MSNLPSDARMFPDGYLDVCAAYARLGAASFEAGPLTARERRPVNRSFYMGAGSERALQSYTRRAVKTGIKTEAVEQMALLACGPLGLPRAVTALTLIRDVVARS